MRFLFFSCILPQLLLLALGEQLDIANNCGRDIFVKNEGANSGPFTLGTGQYRTISINRGPSARVWAHIGCDGGGGNCDTQEGYVSLAEMHFDQQGMTWYDVSQVDGYNLPVKMEPLNPEAGGNCHPASCNFNIDQSCPGASKVYRDGRAVACKNLDRDRQTDYSRAIKGSCPDVYSWSQDDRDGMRACNPGNWGLRVSFC